MNGGMRVEDKKHIDWENYEFTLWQTQLNFAVFCASSACDVSVEHMHDKKHISLSCLLSYQKNIKNTSNSMYFMAK